MKKESIKQAMTEMGVGELAASHNAGAQQPTIAVLTRAAKAWGRGDGPGNADRSLPGGRTVGEVLARAAEIEAEQPATTYKLGRLYGFRPASGTWASTRDSLVDAASDIADDIKRRRGYAVTVELFGADGHHCGDNTDSGTMLVTRK